MANNTTTTKKVTKVDYFNMLAAIVTASGTPQKEKLLNFISHEKELLVNRSSKTAGTPTRKTNEVTLVTIKTVLAEKKEPVTIGELLKDPRLTTYTEETKEGSRTKDMTNQKLSSLVTKLVKAGEVERTEKKKVAYFELKKADSEQVE